MWCPRISLKNNRRSPFNFDRCRDLRSGQAFDSVWPKKRPNSAQDDSFLLSELLTQDTSRQSFLALAPICPAQQPWVALVAEQFDRFHSRSIALLCRQYEPWSRSGYVQEARIRRSRRSHDESAFLKSRRKDFSPAALPSSSRQSRRHPPRSSLGTEIGSESHGSTFRM